MNLPIYRVQKVCETSTKTLLVLQVFKPRTPPEAITLCSRLLEYTPASRFSPLEACSHAFFDELRQPNTRLPSGRELPMLFNFSPTGMYRCQHSQLECLSIKSFFIFISNCVVLNGVFAVCFGKMLWPHRMYNNT